MLDPSTGCSHVPNCRRCRSWAPRMVLQEMLGPSLGYPWVNLRYYQALLSGHPKTIERGARKRKRARLRFSKLSPLPGAFRWPPKTPGSGEDLEDTASPSFFRPHPSRALLGGHPKALERGVRARRRAKLRCSKPSPLPSAFRWPRKSAREGCPKKKKGQAAFF